MNALATQLTQTYRREEELYMRILKLVEQQERIMQETPDPHAVLALCQDVEHVLDEIAGIERGIEPTKHRWEKRNGEEDAPELDDLLGKIQQSIERISQKQDRVRQSLMAYMKEQQRQSESARAGINARKARLAYGSR